jgi:hypothetical protein
MNFNLQQEAAQVQMTLARRHFLARAGLSLGTVALGQLLAGGSARADQERTQRGVLENLPYPRRAKRVIYLFMSGGPSQLDMFDYKPLLNEKNGEELPEEVRKGQRLTGMSGNQASLPLAGSVFRFDQHGKGGAWISELLPHTANMVDEMCIVRSMFTEAINHDPAITFFQTGSQIAGRPSIGAWLSYGLGSANENLPAFCVLITRDKVDQPLYARLWGSGFLPSIHEGVQFRPGNSPVLYLQNPDGISGENRRRMLDQLQELQRLEYQRTQDPQLLARIEQYEMAFRMQTSVPEVVDISGETDAVLEMYGPDVRKPGTFASNCLLARRLAERGVQFIQLFHQGWDQHGNLPAAIRQQCRDTDQPSAALLQDLKQRGMLDDTLVVWGGEFGRTNYSQGKLTATDYGRDHHPRCFTMWMAGGGVAPGLVYGETDPYGYNIEKDPVHVHDLHATILYLLGIDHEQLTYKHQGRRYRLTDVAGKVIQPLVA